MPENKEKKEIISGALKSAEALNTKELATTLQAVIENLEKALKKEKGENARRIEEKLAEAKQLKQKLVDIGKSLLSAKGGNEKAKSKAREGIKNIVGKLDVLLNTREAVEGLKSEIKKPEIKELPTEEELEQVADKAKDFETMEKWKTKFIHTALWVGLTDEQAEIYWQAYLEAPYLESPAGGSSLRFGGRLSPDRISEELKKAFSKYNETISDVALLKRAKIEAFGKLVNGESNNLTGDDLEQQYEIYCEEKIEKIQKQIEKRGAELEKKSVKLERTKASVEKLLQTISSFTKANPSPYNIFGTPLSLEIRQSIGLLNEYNNKIIPDLKAEIDKIESSMKALTGDLFSNQLDLLRHQGADTTQFLLTVSDTLGDDLPSSLKYAVEENKRNYLAIPNVIPEFDRLFYSGQYSKALELLAEQNKERSDVKWLPANVGEQDVLSKYKSQGKLGTFLSSFPVGGSKNSFVNSKIAGGYKLVYLKKVDPLTFGGDIVKSHNNSYNCVLVKEHKNGSIGYIPLIAVTTSGETTIAPYPRDGTEHVISPDRIAEIENRDKELKGNLRKVIASNPNFKKLSNAGKVLQEQFGPLQKLFMAGIEGNKTKNFVELAKEYAGKILTSNTDGALSVLRGNIKQARTDIYALRKFVHAENHQPGMVDEFEQEILKLEESFGNIEKLVSGNAIEQICSQISSTDFSEDTLDRWLVKNAIPFVAMLALAVAGAILFMPLAGVMTSAIGALGGTAGVGVGIFTTSAAGALGVTVGGAVGMELGTLGSHYLGKAIYGNDFSNLTLLTKKWLDDEDIEWSKIAKVYGWDLVVRFSFTFALMGAGQVVGKYLSKFINVYGNNEGLRGSLANALKKIPKLSEHRVDITASNFLGKFTRELLGETGEEATEAVAQNVNSWLGSFAQFYNCLDGRKVRQNMGGFDVTQGRSVQIGNVIEKHWTFDAADTKTFEQTMRHKYERQGFKVDGLVATSEFVSKTGKKIVTRLVFEASPESGYMRQMFADGVDSSGKSEIARLYGVERVPGKNNEYAFSNLSPKGKITLAKYLQKSGFIIQGDINTGEFIATKGDAQLTFRLKSLVSGTNIDTMEDTKPKTLDDAELAVPANTEAGSTVDSPVIDKLQAGVKGALSVAEVGRRLSGRGLPADFLDGISPEKQLQVLNSVAELEREAGLAGDDKQFGDAAERAKPGEDVFVDESVGSKFLSPEKYVELLGDADGLGVYRFGVLLANNPVIPPFSVEQILKIGKENPDLAAFVINKVAQVMPGEFSLEKIAELDNTDSNLAVAALAGLLKTPEGLAIRELYYNDIFSEFEGGKEEFMSTARDLFTKFSPKAFEKMQSALGGLRNPKLSLPILALLTGCTNENGEEIPVTGWIAGKLGGALGWGAGQFLSGAWNGALGLLASTGGAIYLTSLVVGLCNAEKGKISSIGAFFLGAPVDGAKAIVGGAWNLVIKGGKGAMRTRTSAADAAKANQDTRNVLGITTPPVPGANPSDLLNFGVNVNAQIDGLRTTAAFTSVKSNLSTLRSALVTIENNINDHYLHPKLLADASFMSLPRLIGEINVYAVNLNAVIATGAPSAPGLPGDIAGATTVLVNKMTEINNVLTTEIGVPKKGDTAGETEKKTVLNLLKEPLKVSDSPTLREKLWNKRTKLIFIVTAALAAAGGAAWAFWPEKEKPPVVATPPTPNEKAAEESAAAAAAAAAGRTGESESYKPEGAKERATASDEFDSRISGALDHSDEIPAPIVKELERLQTEGHTDGNLELYEKLKADIVKTNGFDNEFPVDPPDWLPDEDGLQLRFVNTFKDEDAEKLVANDPDFARKLTEAKAIFLGEDNDIPADFKSLETDEEKLKYFQKLIDDCANIIVTACK